MNHAAKHSLDDLLPYKCANDIERKQGQLLNSACIIYCTAHVRYGTNAAVHVRRDTV